MCGRNGGPDGGKDELYQSIIESEGNNHDGNMSQEQTSLKELPKEVMHAMEMESFQNVEIPNSNDGRLISKGGSTLLQDQTNNSIFDQDATPIGQAESSSNQRPSANGTSAIFTHNGGSTPID